MKKILFMGDSITDGGVHVAIVDTYLILNNQYGKYLIDNIGLCSETVCGLTEEHHAFPRPNVNDRMEGILKTFEPDFAIIMYGMNDAIYKPFVEENAKQFREGLDKVIKALKQRSIAVKLCTPPCFDKHSSRSKLLSREESLSGMEGIYIDYNDTLKQYADIIKSEYASRVDCIIDVYTATNDYIAARRQTNPNYNSGDGVHPNLEVNYVMANCVLTEGLGVTEGISPLHKDKIFNKLFTNVYKRDSLVHKHYKETIGHCLPWKDRHLPMDKLKKVINKLNIKISAIAGMDITRRQLKWSKCSTEIFHFHGYTAVMVIPDKPDNKGSWMLRTEFFGAYTAADKAALEHGYHVAYINMPNMYGSTASISQYKEFYDHCKAKYQLSRRVLLLGISRGALSAINFADNYPKLTQGIIIDNGVVDIRSWPLGENVGIGSAIDAARIKSAYGQVRFDASYAIELEQKLLRLPRNNIKVYNNSNDRDDVVPYSENGLLIKEAYGVNNPNYREKINAITGHHPHSTYDYTDIIEWFTGE